MRIPQPQPRFGPLLVFIIGLLFTPMVAAESALLLPAEKARLIEMIRKNAAAGSVFAKLEAQAGAALDDTPNPIKKVQTESKLAGDPVKTATQTALKDMRALSVLGYVYAVTGAPRYANQARALILAWARVNQPTGEPIDETNLEPLLVAYDLTRDTFPDDAQKTTDAYLRALVAAEWNARQLTNNWQSHRLKIVGLAAYVLRDDALIARAIEGLKAQIGANLNADGSSYDFHQRDALHYHVYDLEPLLTLAIAAEKHGLNLYDFSGNGGGSLRQSVHFLVPYCTGEKQHEEYVNSKVKFDRQRADNGEKGFKTGRPFQPDEGFKALSLAAYFDRSVDPLIDKLAAKDRNPAILWTLLMNAASRTK